MATGEDVLRSIFLVGFAIGNRLREQGNMQTLVVQPYGSDYAILYGAYAVNQTGDTLEVE